MRYTMGIGGNRPPHHPRPMTFHYRSTEEARAALYDAAMLLLQADPQIGLPFSPGTITDLSTLVRRIADGQRVSQSPLLDI